MVLPVSTSSERPGSGDDRSVCTPCRGTGKLISGFGGTPHEVTCPWCGGTGAFQPGSDAQAGRTADDGG
jgi:DnaJ-class molecular chaperone